MTNPLPPAKHPVLREIGLTLPYLPESCWTLSGLDTGGNNEGASGHDGAPHLRFMIEEHGDLVVEMHTAQHAWQRCVFDRGGHLVSMHCSDKNRHSLLAAMRDEVIEAIRSHCMDVHAQDAG